MLIARELGHNLANIHHCKDISVNVLSYRSSQFCQTFEFGAVQKCASLVDLETCYNMSISFKKSGFVRSGNELSKFVQQTYTSKLQCLDYLFTAQALVKSNSATWLSPPPPGASGNVTAPLPPHKAARVSRASRAETLKTWFRTFYREWLFWDPEVDAFR